jgi:hypothetical protein
MFILGSLCTVLLVWPVYLILSALLLMAFPHLAWLAIGLCAVPALSRAIDSLQRRYSVSA